LLLQRNLDWWLVLRGVIFKKENKPM